MDMYEWNCSILIILESDDQDPVPMAMDLFYGQASSHCKSEIISKKQNPEQN